MSHYATYEIAGLQHILEQRHLRVSGNKAELISRLTAYDSDHPFPFLKLPAEIRNEIYKYVAASELTPKKGAIKSAVETRDLAHHVRVGDMNTQAYVVHPALFRTCSQIYKETRVLFYRYHAFKLHLWPEHKSLLSHLATLLGLSGHLNFLERVTRWLDGIKVDMRQEIRRLEVKVHYYDHVSGYLECLDNIHARLSDEATFLITYRPISGPSQRYGHAVL